MSSVNTVWQELPGRPVESLGGTIAIHSAERMGTSIVVTLPIAREPDHEIE